MSSEIITYDVVTFCKQHHISRSLFYKLVRENRGPKLMRVGRRTLITEQSAKKWREQMEFGGCQ